MVMGIAIQSYRDTNARYIVPQGMINHKTIKLISVLKCPMCGYSDDGR